MAGKLGFMTRETPLLAVLSIFKRTPSSYLPLKPGICKYPLHRRTLSQLLRMGQQDVQNGSHEVKEPTPKIAKLHENRDVSGNPTSFFRVKKLSEKAVLPSRGSPLSAGYDLSSATETTVPARGKALVPTDLSIAVPEGTYARIAPRSGLAWKHSIDVGAGVIDADYRGSVGVILFNHSDVDFEIKEGDRIAQLIIEKIITPDVVEVEDLDSTARGAGGFGSTGV
ncbi:PREDICTED: deoxyuridine 5'-triphosphate nucleotidohydrolase [Prunus mume]|uniref:Deoxyuridine 5'-triphosphate nucleotidohydrolase n=1 Tax=Prunus mume TaxID=102107 RepID=A0ABM0N7U5_PRUMU|nr:PREDICTED: deoxyuridine 5'-triphosphate nucleotidohydrolase [Prunus mume]